MLVGFASTHGGCAHYRAELPARMLRRAGWDTAWTVDLDVGTAGGFGFPGGLEPDVVVLAGGWPTGLAAEHIRAARANGQRVIADCDDWPWLPAENPHATPDGGERKIAALRAADVVTVSTPYLRDELRRRAGIDAILCRNVIDSSAYAFARAVNAIPPARPPVIGYRGLLCGFHDADVRELAGVAHEARWLHIGADVRAPRSFGELAGVSDVEEIRARAFEDGYPRLLAGVDVAVIPFARRPFSLAKSNIAALEWTAAGVPWIASDQPEYLALSSSDCVRSARGWRRELERLRDPRERFEQHRRQSAAAASWQVSSARGLLGWLEALEVVSSSPSRRYGRAALGPS